ncbi:carboxypeptidase-like regulatory domain-containing protein [Chondromyces crocatus]|uniref:carboxypeptidase-like regulatory domain-containing protein n=1 Tax=Chondromyces crocatus TaxID=52 RepID=UPI0012E15341|nr:carboxypeptidase-like regulatory domain-containing protein [Chondromyces crocatus]
MARRESVEVAAAALSDGDRAELLMNRHLERLERDPVGIVTGRVLNVDEAPVSGVIVRVAGNEVMTDDGGKYTLTNVPGGNQVASFEHAEYVFSQRLVAVHPGEHQVLDSYLLGRSQSRRINVDAPVSIRNGPLSLEFEPGDLGFADDGKRGAAAVPISGEVDVVFTTIDPLQKNHILAAPAGLTGITVKGEPVDLVSYAMLEVELFKDGRKVQVRSGQTVRTTLVVDDALAVKSGEIIPMWHHDTDLGVWVQAGGTDAVVQPEKDGSLIAVAELPHFSSWNYDSVGDATCAQFVLPGNQVTRRIRIVSTDSQGAMDHLWSITSECMNSGSSNARCFINVPSGARASTSFKVQAQQAGTNEWCDLTFQMGPIGQRTRFMGADINQWLNNFERPTGSWCGQSIGSPRGGFYLGGTYDIGSFGPPLPPNHVVLGMAQSSCPGVGGLSVSNIDAGFSAMVSNASNPATSANIDRDGAVDAADNCIANSSSQSDVNGNGIGDMCEAWCHVSPAPYAYLYDYDGDGIDDLCDNRWTVFNPSQYLPQ